MAFMRLGNQEETFVENVDFPIRVWETPEHVFSYKMSGHICLQQKKTNLDIYYQNSASLNQRAGVFACQAKYAFIAIYVVDNIFPIIQVTGILSCQYHRVLYESQYFRQISPTTST